jgi:branched-chain amino acid transport system substrate-binding protein
LKQCGDELSPGNVMKQAASLKNLVCHVASGIRKNAGPTDFRPIKQMQLITFDGKQWVRFGEDIANKPVSAL